MRIVATAFALSSVGPSAALAQVPDAQLPQVPLPVPAPALPSLPTDDVPSLPAVPVPAPPEAVLPEPRLPAPPSGIVSPLPRPIGPGAGGGPILRFPGGSVREGGAPETFSDHVARLAQGGGEAADVATAATVAAAAATGAPDARLSALSAAERRRLSTAFWDTRLEGARLRRLRHRLLEHWSCAGVLSRKQRRTVVMRAGLFGRRPATRRQIARRVRVPLMRAFRLERAGIRRLTSTEACIDAGGAALGTSVPAASAAGPAPGADTRRGTDGSDAGGVLGAFQFELGDIGLSPLDDGDAGVPDALFFFLFVVLVVVGGAAAAARLRGHMLPIPPPTRLRRRDKPLLFLDVDGVIALSPFAGPLPPGRWYRSGRGQLYVAERAGELVRALARRYEIVWASGWGNAANRFRDVLGLEENLPVLKFGRDAVSGPSSWKIRWVQRAAGRRPAAWVDDTIGQEHRHWASERHAPTLLVKTAPNTGIAEEHVRRLLAWADQVEPERPGRFARRRHVRAPG